MSEMWKYSQASIRKVKKENIMGIFSTSEQFEIELIKIDRDKAILKMTKQTYDGPFPVNKPITKILSIKVGDKKFL